MAPNGHCDVNIPTDLQPRLGFLLADFGAWLRAAHPHVVIKGEIDKEPGGHITNWWLYTAGDSLAPKQTQMVFGETTHPEVNRIPHMWVRAKSQWLNFGVALLEEWLAALDAAPRSPSTRSLPPMPARQAPHTEVIGVLTVAHYFDPSENGPDYLELHEGDRIIPLDPPEPGQGWAYGMLLGGSARRGWYPPEYAK